MSDRFPGAIQIGGAAPRRLAEDLAHAISDAGLLAEADAAPAVIQTAEDLLAGVDPTTHVIRLYDHEASYGAFPDLEAWLRDHGIAYDRQSDARYEFDGQAVSYRPSLGLVERTATQDGAPTVPLGDLLPVRELLKAALANTTVERVKAALDELEKATGPEVPPLDPFVLVD